MCSFSESFIENETSKNIYIILRPTEAKFKKDNFDFFIQKSKLKNFLLDSTNNTATFLLKPNQKLYLYDGPGSDPIKLVSSLKIVTPSEIIDLNDKASIQNRMTNIGITYKLTIK